MNYLRIYSILDFFILKTFIPFVFFLIVIMNPIWSIDLSKEIKSVAFKQSKRISKIVIKEGACNSLNGHLINTCNQSKKSNGEQKYVHKKKPITLEYIQHLRSYVKKDDDFNPWTKK